MDHRLPIRKTPKRYYFWLIVHLLLTLITVLWLVPAMWEASFGSYINERDKTSDQAAAQMSYIARHVQEPFDGYAKHQVLNQNFAVIALSHMATGVMNIHQNDPSTKNTLQPTIEAILKRARHPKVSPYKKDLKEVQALGDHNLYLSHLNIILGVHRHITKDKRTDKLHTRISKHLVKKSINASAHARSYPIDKSRLKKRPNANRWPADQSVLLASLYLYDKTRSARLSTLPIQKWLGVMQKQLDPKTKLHLPTMDQQLHYAKLPRGCALSWTLLYMSQFAPKQAEQLYTHYRKHHAKNLFSLGVGGFREWPELIDRGMDDDSGPILFGVGAAATGLGLGASRLMKDHAMYVMIQRTATAAGLPLVLGNRRSYITSPILGDAILFHGTTARRWFGKQIDRDAVEPKGVPGACFILLFFAIAFLLYNLMGIREQYWNIKDSV